MVCRMSELTVDATRENLDQVLAFLDGALEEMLCPMKAQMQLDVAVEELYVNIASYSYPEGGGSAQILLEPLEGPRGIAVTFVDSGVPFDPLAKPDPDVTLPAEQRQIGGLGIYMVKKSMDSVLYRYENGQNILRIEKHF